MGNVSMACVAIDWTGCSGDRGRRSIRHRSASMSSGTARSQDQEFATATAVTLPAAFAASTAAGNEPECAPNASQDVPRPVRDLMYREATYRRLLACADCVAVLGAIILAAELFHVAIRLSVLLAAPLAVLVAKAQGLYDRDETVIRKSTIAEWRSIVETASLTSICIYLCWRALTTASRGAGMRLFIVLVAAGALLDIAGRALARDIARRNTRPDRCLIVGDVDGAGHLAKTISALDGVELVGGVGIDDVGATPQDLQEIIDALDVHRLVIAPRSRDSQASTLDLVRRAKLLGLRVSIFPTVLAAVGGRAVLDELDGHTLLGVPRFGLTRSSAAMKRAFDVVGSALALILLAPLMAGIALLIRLDSPGTILYAQQRVGRDGKLFRMLKFRSMVEGADHLKASLTMRNEAADGLFKISDDPRITRVGRLLRRSHLDELPQLWNILRGEMSLVGPRPLIVEEDDRITGADRIRLSLTPGLTGPWQVCGPLTTPLSEMVKLDYLYISNWSLWRDVDILLRTAARVLGGHGR